MRITNILFRRRRRGVSTILGTIIFIGIMFTSVIPMWLVMKQADVLFERKMLEMARLDDEAERESMELYAFPSSYDEPEYLNITAYNTCEVPINLVRLWVNGTVTPLSITIPVMGSVNVPPYEINATEGSSYQSAATSERGNVYVSQTGTLSWSGGEWETETVGINLIFPSRPGSGQRGNDWKNKLEITIAQDSDIIFEDVVVYWAISASEMFFELGAPGKYNVTVWTKQTNPDPYEGVIYGPERLVEGVGCDPITIDWPAGPAILDVNFMVVNDPGDEHLEIDE
ncbi:hypothetical protein ES703_26442 [subsurface metagenome]